MTRTNGNPWPRYRAATRQVQATALRCAAAAAVGVSVLVACAAPAGAIQGAAAPPAAAQAPTAPPAAGQPGAGQPQAAAPAPAVRPVAKLDGMSIRDILAKSVQARGGIQKLHAVQTRRETGSISLEAGTTWPFIVEHKRPRSMRMEIDLPGSKLIRAYDGLHGWQMQPMSKNAEPLTADDLHNIHNESDFDFAGALIDTDVKGHADLLAKETVDGATAYRVKIILLNGDVFYYDIDATTFLPIHWEGARTINHKLVVFESSYSDYRDVGGVQYAFKIASWMQGSNQKNHIVFTQIENNPPIDDTRFTEAPTAAATPAPKPGAPPAGAR